MPVLLLTRATPLTPEEAARLPRGAVAADGTDGVVARADVELPQGGLLAFAVALGRAVPDAVFAVQEGPAAELPDADPWRLVEEGRFAEAERVFAAGRALEADGRARLRAMWRLPDAEVVALGCRIARVAGWRSAASDLRSLLGHAHPLVRRDAALALGDLAGPSVLPSLRPLLTDPDAEVRAAAQATTGKLGG